MLIDLEDCFSTEDFINYNQKNGFFYLNKDSEILNNYSSLIEQLKKENENFTINLICKSLYYLGKRNHDKAIISSIFFKHDPEFSYLFDLKNNNLFKDIKHSSIKKILFYKYPYYVPALIQHINYLIDENNFCDAFINSYNGLIFSYDQKDYKFFERIYISSRKKLNLDNNKYPSFKNNDLLSIEQIKQFYKLVLGEEINDEILVKTINNIDSNLENTFLEIVKDDKFIKNNEKLIEIIASKNL